MATVDKEQILEALSKLDHTNNDMWTDDGLPRTSAVQKLVGDTTIKRGDIQAAAPDFARKITTDAEGVALGTDTVVAEFTATAAAPIESPTEGDGGVQMTE